MYDDVNWSEIQFTDDESFVWDEVIWSEPEPLPESFIWELTQEELDAMASVPFGAFDDVEPDSVEDYPRDELRGPFWSDFDAYQYASQINGAQTAVIYDSFKDAWYVWVGGSDGRER